MAKEDNGQERTSQKAEAGATRNRRQWNSPQSVPQTLNGELPPLLERRDLPDLSSKISQSLWTRTAVSYPVFPPALYVGRGAEGRQIHLWSVSNRLRRAPSGPDGEGCTARRPEIPGFLQESVVSALREEGPGCVFDHQKGGLLQRQLNVRKISYCWKLTIMVSWKQQVGDNRGSISLGCK